MPSDNSASGQDGVTGTRYTLIIKKGQNIRKSDFQGTEHSEWQLFLRDWKQMIWSLKLLHVITLRKFPGCGTGRGIHTGTGWLPEVRTWTVETGDQMQWEFSGKSTRQERAAETENHGVQRAAVSSSNI